MSTAPLVVLTQLRASELRHMCYLFEVFVKSARQRETPNVAARGTTLLPILFLAANTPQRHS